MSGKTRTGQAASARDKARTAKAALDAERAAHDRLVEDAATQYYEADEQATAAQARLDAAHAAGRAALRRLDELGQNLDAICALCDVTPAQVRAAKKETPTPDTAPADPPTKTPTEATTTSAAGAG